MRYHVVAMKRFLLLGAALIVGVTLAVGAQAPASKASVGDWPMYGGDARGDKFSALKDITPENVSRLVQAWSVQLTPPAGRRGAPPAVAQGD